MYHAQWQTYTYMAVLFRFFFFPIIGVSQWCLMEKFSALIWFCLYLFTAANGHMYHCWRRMWTNMNRRSKFGKIFVVIKNLGYDVVCKADLTSLLSSFKQEVEWYHCNSCSTLTTLKNISQQYSLVEYAKIMAVLFFLFSFFFGHTVRHVGS